MSLLFGKESAVVVGPEGFFIVENNDAMIRGFDTSGSERSVLAPPGKMSPSPITEEDLRAARRMVSRHRVPGVDLRKTVEKMPIPDSYPPFGWDGDHSLNMMTLTGAGELWVLHFGGIGERRNPRWTVFRNDGSIRGSVESSEDVSLLDARGSLALVLTWDGFDVERVELRSIVWE